jgi:hypothetical protein
MRSNASYFSSKSSNFPGVAQTTFVPPFTDEDGLREAPELDDTRPKCEPVWEIYGQSPRYESLSLLNFDVPIRAAVVSYPRRPSSDWEGALVRREAAYVLPQTGLDLRAIVTAAATRQQPDGEHQNPRERHQPHDHSLLESGWITNSKQRLKAR